jgi:hypothetical protein
MLRGVLTTMDEEMRITRHAARGAPGSCCPAIISAGFCCALAACAPAAPPPVVAHEAPKTSPAAPLPDWFHRQLALARHARVTFAPHADQTGAQLAYYKVMVPACQRVIKSGPDKYRGRCVALLHHANMAAVADAAKILPPPDDFACNDDHDDGNDPPALVTACND